MIVDDQLSKIFYTQLQLLWMKNVPTVVSDYNADGLALLDLSMTTQVSHFSVNIEN